MVVDTSALLAVIFGEEHGLWAAEIMAEHAPALRMSTVNLAETLIILEDRQPQLAAELEEAILMSGIRFVPPDAQQARTAAKGRLRFPLNLGDCFAYALAAAEGCPLLAVDSDFRAVDVQVELPERDK